MTTGIIQGFNLSPHQKRLWLLQQGNDSQSYCSLCAIKITGDLDLKTFKTAIDNITDTQEILRTSFDLWTGMTIPIQVINERSVILIDNYDLTELDTENQERAILTFFEEIKKEKINLKEVSNFYVSLLKLSPSLHILIIKLPALCADAAGLKNLIYKISQAYTVCLHNKQFVQEPVQYVLFSEWQNELLEAEETKAGREYWQKKDISYILTLKLSGENQRLVQSEFIPQNFTQIIHSELASKIEELASKHDSSESVCLLACWQILLWRLTGESNMIVGTDYDGRTEEELKDALGLFTKYLPIYCHLDDESKFSEVVKQVAISKTEVYDWQECFTWELILRANDTVIGLPFFPFCFDFDEQSTNYSNGDLSFSIYKQYTCLERFKVKLSCVRKNETLLAEFHYDSALFLSEDIQRLAGQFQTLLESLIRNPQTMLSELKILSNVERQSLLFEFNKTKTDFPQDKCLHELFVEQVERTPENIAVVFEDQQLTYAQLNAQANQLAHYLQKLGAKPDMLVAVCVERSLEMVVGLLGVIKAGGAYLPLDSTYPKERLAFMLEDSQAPMLLTQQRLLAILPEHQSQIICLDSDCEIIAQQSEENPVTKITTENLVYVIYTSGSTGLPKGAMLPHRAICNHMFWMQMSFPLTEQDKVLQKTPFSFDASVWEFYAPLLVGAQLAIARPGGHQDSNYLIKVIAEQQITILQLVPSSLQMLLEHDGIKSCTSLKRVFCGGEALPVALQERFFALLDVELHNLYGPTETCIDATFWTCQREVNQQIVPIGRPIANTQIYILDSNLQCVPIGVPGELYIGGAGLAQGYLNRPELTAEKFIPNPFFKSDELEESDINQNDILNAGNSRRLYKTGDQARYTSDGNIEYLGRIDHQVKIRGFRIELAEIESVVLQHPHVQAVVVIAREYTLGDQRLVAYLVSHQNQTPTMSELQQFLKQKLPDYMIPTAFVFLEALPLTPNGKVDRRNLPAPDMTQELEKSYVAPRNATEEILALIWADVLGVQLVGIHDNFFSLGGHSLLATQLISRVRTTFEVELPLRTLFEAATVAELAQELKQFQQGTAQLKAPPLVAIARDGQLPLSFAQQRLWFLDQLEPNSAFYNIPAAAQLNGQLNIAALEHSLREIIRRHEALRTNFITLNGQPVQIINPLTAWTLPVVDLRSVTINEQQMSCVQLATQEAQRPFHLEKEPLVRGNLLVLEETKHILLVTMHHIVSDGWSMGIVVRELSTLYTAFCQGQPSPLEELPIQYADFAVWQRQWLVGDVLQSQLTYWQQQLAEAPALLELPTDRPRPAVQSFRGAHQCFTLPVELTGALHQLSRQQGVTLFMTLLAAFDILLYRYTGQTDILVGSPIANRNHSEIEGLIGFFVNTLVLRTHISGHLSFEELLGRVREVALGAYAHQDLPFEMLVEALHLERNLSQTPLFQVVFALQNAPVSEMELPGLTLSPLTAESLTAKFDLTLSLENTALGLVGTWEYNTDLFDASTIKRMAGHYQTLLEGIVASPEQPLSQLPLLTASEQQQLLFEWNETQADYPKNKCIHQLFEEQVERTPEAVAVVFENQQLTYSELNCRANQLAHYLQTLGVVPDVLVGICVERSLEMVVGLLAILKAGGAYVPLDPDYPPQRLSFMLEDSRVQVLLTQQRLVDRFNQTQATVVCLDTNPQATTHQNQENCPSSVTADNLCYVIYTSGSTGTPKGVAVVHRAVNRLVCNTNYIQLNPRDQLAQVSNASFDAATFEIWGALVHGAKLVVISKDVVLSPLDFAAYIREQKISVLFLTTALFNQLAWSVPQAFQDLRHLLFGGEAVDIKSVKAVVEKSCPQRLLHVYGPTESTTFSSWYLVENIPQGATNLPIGRAISNTQIYLLDSNLQPVPIGVPGELHIGGDGLAQGYLHRPELTAEKFIPNPFENSKSNLLYKTGDLARYLNDGNIEYLGRIDHQVKLRGFRIELTEIESVLAQHPYVQAVVVIIRESTPGDKRLVAYIVPHQEKTPTINELRRFLLERLPEYMVPKALVLLEALPLTPNGKLDRRNLPAPDMTQELETSYVAPRNPTEEILALMWADVLGVQQVGMYDNFFHLGGHSLLATQLISRVRITFQVELPLRTLFEAATVADFAQCLKQFQQDVPELKAPPLQAIARDGQLPLSFAQQRLWFLDQLQPDSAFYNIPTAVQLTGQLHITALEHSFREIIRRHEILRTNFVTQDGQPVQIIQPLTAWTLPVIDLGLLKDSEQEMSCLQLATQEAQRPFDLEKEPLVRVSLLVLEQTKHILLVTMHHIVSDGWSIGVLLKELTTLYSAFYHRQPSSLKDLPIQYADFAMWQRQWLVGDVLQSQLAYWQQQLADAPALLELPTDRPRPAVQSFRGAQQSFILPVELTQALHQLSRQQGVTLFMTLLAAFDILLYRYTGQTDIVVGSPIANRNRSEIEGLIGFFVNTLVLRTHITDDLSFEELLGRVREVALGAYAHQDLPFEMLVDVLQPVRDLSYAPLFQVMFILQNAPMGKLQLPSVTLTPLEVENVTAKFDLTLSMWETQEGIQGSCEYNSDLFEVATITRMIRHFQTLLQDIVANSQQLVKKLSLLNAHEAHQLLVEWNNTDREYSQFRCVHQLFEAQVERSPDAVAVVFEDEQMTYYELNVRANQLAHHLQTLGVGPQTLVGICLERSVAMLVGLLAILKAGGAYVPLDPAYPQERLAFMLADTNASVLLTQEQLIQQLPQHKARVVCIDKCWKTIIHNSQENLRSDVTDDNLVYVIYTSGSTGQPKGISLAHRPLVNLLEWHYESLRKGARTLQFASLNFDASFHEIFAALGTGGSLFVVSEDLRVDTVGLGQFISKQAIEKVILPVVVLQQLAELVGEGGIASLHPGVFRSLREVTTTGEQLQITKPIIKLFKSLKDCSFHNHYGPSETHVVTALHLEQNPDNWMTYPPIGVPIANTQIYLLDKYLNPVPIGVSGEVYIGGISLAQGYLNRPELTAEKFIPNPFFKSDELEESDINENDILNRGNSRRLYKTGDQARHTSDGNIEYLGRIDNQVKIRGFRIELAEIESVVLQHPHVQAVVVIAREYTLGDQRLVAYLVSDEKQTPSIGELQLFLKQKLPDYMIPNAFVFLEALPLTPNGKVDRRNLPAPDMTQELEKSYVAPRNATEEILAMIWADVLGVQLVGIYDNFFSLGGHSLLATQLISRVRTTFQVELPLRTLFEAATVAELAQELKQSPQDVPQLKAPPLVAITRDGQLPLSFAQQRLWFLDQLEPNSAFYNIPAAVQLNGQLNIAALEHSFREIIRRHEALRTNFITLNGQPVQIINPLTAWTLPVVDLRSVTINEQQMSCVQLATQEAQRPFHLEKEPLVRGNLLVLEETKHILLVTMHHIVSDGWSMGIVVRELSTLYTAFCQGQPSPLEELAIQYADFAVWQRQWLVGDVLESQLAYWQQQLADAPALLELPTDRPRPAVQSFQGAHQSFTLPVELTQALNHLSRQQGVTLFMTLLAAFDILLYRYTGQTDIVVGSPIANRNRSEIEGLIGFFVNTLVLRTHMSGDLSFEELLGRVREVALGAYAHQDLPFEMLVEALHLERNLSYAPLFQVAFVLQNAPVSEMELPGLTLSPLTAESLTAKFDLTLSLENTALGLVGTWEYNTDLFDASTIKRMAGHYQTLLEGIVASPEQPLSQLPVLTASEQQQLLFEWNDTQADYPQNRCIHQLFEEQVERTPDAVAVVFENQQLTYTELNCRANQLAHHLQTLGVGPDVLVGICVERSLEMVVGLLAILKAGGAYVPLDPDYPPQRLSFMLEDSRAQVLLTQQRLVNRLPEHQGLTVFFHQAWEHIVQHCEENPKNGVTASNLANVIYTSGSTGTPKGVMVQHQGLCNLALAQIQAFDLLPSSHILQFASFSFDASIWEVVMALLSGARLCLGTKDSLLPGTPLIALLNDYAITHVTLPPSVLTVLPVTQLPALQTLILAGEACSAEYIRQWSGGRRLFNAYGPTEATVCATMGECRDDHHQPPIGRPIANTQIYILDPNLQPVPIGVPGELHIGGIGLARGYLNRCELTAEKFIPNPFENSKSHRLYKTGDLARYLNDGNIEYLGRIDHQVKVRGFRIELAEIESVLVQHPHVQAVVVIAREDSPGDKRLVGYIVPHPEQSPPMSDLRNFVSSKLPGYMVPSTFVLLGTLPLTPNGKVDRRALSAPEVTASTLTKNFGTPRDFVELQLTQIWEDILRIHPVGIQDNFFDLGGHSLLAVQLMARIEKNFGKYLPLSTLFQEGTIEYLANILRQQIEPQGQSPLVTIQLGGSKLPLFCVHPVGGNVFCYIDLVRHIGSEQPFYGLQAFGLDGKQEPCSQIENMASQYIAALRTVQPEGPYLLGGWSMGGIVALEMAQQLQAQGQKIALLALMDTTATTCVEPTDENDLALWGSFVQDIGLSPENPEFFLKQFLQIESKQRLVYILEQAKIANLLPPDMELFQFQNLFHVFETNIQAIRGYTPQQFTGQVTLFKANDQFAQVPQNPTMGWDNLATEGVDIHVVPGNHYTILRQPHVQILAQKLRTCLNEIQVIYQ